MKKEYNKWTYEKCQEEAQKYTGRFEFQKNNGNAYSYAYNNGFLDDICSHMSQKQKRWTLEMLAAEAIKYNSKSEFQRNSAVAYTTASRRKVLDLICGHMEELRHEWTDEELYEEALKYESRSEFAQKSCGAYTTATRRGILDSVCQHMERKGSRIFRGLYVFEYPISKKAYIGLTYNYNIRYQDHLRSTKSIISMNKTEKHIFKTLDIFYPKNIAAIKEQELIDEYKNRGWTILNKMKGGGLGGNILKWTKEAIMKESKKYTTRSNFVRGSCGAYDAAHRMGILDEVCAHMPKRSKLGDQKKMKPIMRHPDGKIYSSVNDAAKGLNVSPSAISNVLAGKRSHVKGYNFIYINKNKA